MRAPAHLARSASATPPQASAPKQRHHRREAGLANGTCQKIDVGIDQERIDDPVPGRSGNCSEIESPSQAQRRDAPALAPRPAPSRARDQRGIAQQQEREKLKRRRSRLPKTRACRKGKTVSCAQPASPAIQLPGLASSFPSARDLGKVTRSLRTPGVGRPPAPEIRCRRDGFTISPRWGTRPQKRHHHNPPRLSMSRSISSSPSSDQQVVGLSES